MRSSILAFAAVLLWASLALAAPLVARARPDLFRLGNANSPKFDNVRDKDVTVVKGLITAGGISTDSKKSGVKNEWVLSASTALPAGLTAVNDHGTHFLIKPLSPMSEADFKAKMVQLNGLATKVPVAAPPPKAAAKPVAKPAAKPAPKPAARPASPTKPKKKLFIRAVELALSGSHDVAKRVADDAAAVSEQSAVLDFDDDFEDVEDDIESDDE